jgi:hypothetical protein
MVFCSGGQTRKIVAKFEEAIGLKEEYGWVDQQRVSLDSHLANLRASFASMTDEEWQQSVMVRDKMGNPVEVCAKSTMREELFPLSVQLPKHGQLFACLNRQQALLTEQQKAVGQAQSQMFASLQEQICAHVKEMQQETQRFVASEMQNLKSCVTSELEEDRKIRVKKHKEVLEYVEATSGMHLEQSAAAVALIDQVRVKCEKNAEILEEMPGTYKQLQKLETQVLPDIVAKIQVINDSVKAISTDLEVVPEILQGFHVSHANLSRVESSLEKLPKLCGDTFAKCDSVHRIAEQLKSLPDVVKASQSTCEDIHRMAVDSQPTLKMLWDARSLCGIIRESLGSLEPLPKMCESTSNVCGDIHQLVRDLMQLHDAMRTAQSTCESIQESVNLLPSEFNALRGQAVETREIGLIEYAKLVESINAVSEAVANSQPLTEDQYVQLTGVLQTVLAEMRNPIPQPKMSFANAVVHVHKGGKKCDEVAQHARLICPKGKAHGLSVRSLLDSSTELDSVEVPMSNLTGRLRMTGGSESPRRQADSSRPKTAY